jgi:hypothetical protein
MWSEVEVEARGMEEISRSCDKSDRDLEVDDEDEAPGAPLKDAEERRGLDEGLEDRYLCRTDSSTGHESAEEGIGGWSGGKADEMMEFAGRLEELLLPLAGAGEVEPKVKETMVWMKQSVNVARQRPPVTI